MGRGLAVQSNVAKKIKIPRDIIAIDLYLQNVVINLGYEVVYNPSAVVLFRPANTLEDFASQVLRASNGHKQITSIYGKTEHHLDYKVALSEGLRNVVKDPIGAASVFLCCLMIPYYKWRIRDLNSPLWHTALRYEEYLIIKNRHPFDVCMFEGKRRIDLARLLII